MVKQSSIDLISKLISFDTTSRESNLDLISFIQKYLSDNGVDSTLVHNEDGNKANLYATIGDPGKSGVMLSGHTDVVPVDGQNWDTDPFEMTNNGSRLYGRGTSDMKGFIGVALGMVPAFQAQKLNTPIHLAFSYDEEIGCIGVRRMIDMINTLPVKPAMAIIGEPTNMDVVIGHKGMRSYDVTVTGLESHSSLAPGAVNAIEYAAELITYIKSIALRIAEDGPFDELFDVTHTTLQTGVIEGGTALNIVPNYCKFIFEMRFIDKEDPDAIESEIRDYANNNLIPRMQEISKDTGIAIERVNEMPSLDLGASEETVTFVKALAGRNNHSKVAFGTEAGLFQKRSGIPSVVCGPGSIGEAHKPNEFIEIAQIEECETFMERLLEQCT
jgi:acetylornithine deacetylase